jgi:hypothetical protein
MSAREGTGVDGDKLAGSWSVHDVTAALKDRDAAGIREALAELDRGGRDLSALVPGDAGGAPAIVVEIQPAGGMKMTIRRSMRPDLPATMTIRATIRWVLSGDQMTTQADPKSLTVGVEIEGGAGLSGEPLAEAKRKAAEIEAEALPGMRGDPLWTSPNVVTVLHAGPRTFLTRGSAGNLMLHVRKDATSD